MNEVKVSGNLTRDPELRYLGSGDRRFPVTTLNVAVLEADGRWDRETGDTQVKTSFLRVEVRGDHAVQVTDEARKGDKVVVFGSLSQYTSGPDGKKQTHTQITAEYVAVIPRQRVDVPPVPADDSDFQGEEPF